MLEKYIKPSGLKRFSIYGLFGYKNITIPFNENVMILMGENGTGKTTILNALCYTLSCRFSKLSAIEFDKIVLEFDSGNIAEVPKPNTNYFDFDTDESTRAQKLFLDLAEQFNEDEIMDLIEASNESDLSIFRNGPYASRLRRLGFPSRMILNALQQIGGFSQKEFTRAKELIKSEIPYEILYFPTYRRIEEDLKRLGINLDSESAISNQIQFGMNDVAKTFEELTSAIKDSAIQGFAKVTGEMLSQLVDGINVTAEMRESLKQQDALKIVLDRVGSNITEAYKENIDDLIKSDRINEEIYDPLVYFLSNLIKIYDQQREKDAVINRFAAVCNDYLVGKTVDYDESKVNISINQSSCKDPLDISKLSSGEKQIVSLFCKIYLNADRNFVILFDEPELSLSIEWQRLLLPHILQSGKCSLLIAVTHSPFIFDNELDQYAHDLGLLSKEDRNGCY